MLRLLSRGLLFTRFVCCPALLGLFSILVGLKIKLVSVCKFVMVMRMIIMIMMRRIIMMMVNNKYHKESSKDNNRCTFHRNYFRYNKNNIKICQNITVKRPKCYKYKGLYSQFVTPHYSHLTQNE